MSSFMENVQPAVKKETKKVAVSTGIGVVLMWMVCGILHMIIPEKVPFDYSVSGRNRRRDHRRTEFFSDGSHCAEGCFHAG